MYNYKFESIDYEEQYAFELMHRRKFTSAELDEMVLKAIKKYIEEKYNNYLLPPCYLNIGSLFLDESLENTLAEMFGFEKIQYESKVEYGGEALFKDDFRHKNGTNFKEMLKDVKVPKCNDCNSKKCLIENERF